MENRKEMNFFSLMNKLNVNKYCMSLHVSATIFQMSEDPKSKFRIPYNLLNAAFKRSDLPFITNSDLKLLNLYSLMCAGKVTSEDILTNYLERMSLNAHPSSISKMMTFGEWICDMVKECCTSDWFKYIELYEKLYDVCHINFQNAFDCSKIHIDELDSYSILVNSMNHINSCICGSIVECCVAEAFDASFDTLTFADKTKYEVNRLINYFIVYFSKNPEEYLEKLNNQFDDCVEYINCSESSKKHYKSIVHFVLWKAFMHYVERGDYGQYFEDLLKLLELLEKPFFNTMFQDYIKAISINPLIKKFFDQSKPIIHNKGLDECDYKGLHYWGEYDFLTSSGIVDIKSYKCPGVDDIDAWFKQIYLYNINIHKGDVTKFDKLIVIELYNNNIYISKKVE